MAIWLSRWRETFTLLVFLLLCRCLYCSKAKPFSLRCQTNWHCSGHFSQFPYPITFCSTDLSVQVWNILVEYHWIEWRRDENQIGKEWVNRSTLLLQFTQSHSDVWTSEHIELDRSSRELWPDASVIALWRMRKTERWKESTLGYMREPLL